MMSVENVSQVSGMELNEREKFILHLTHSLMGIADGYEVKRVINHIRKNRCRNLTTEEIIDLTSAIKMELILGKTIWEEY